MSHILSESDLSLASVRDETFSIKENSNTTPVSFIPRELESSPGYNEQNSDAGQSYEHTSLIKENKSFLGVKRRNRGIRSASTIHTSLLNPFVPQYITREEESELMKDLTQIRKLLNLERISSSKSELKSSLGMPVGPISDSRSGTLPVLKYIEQTGCCLACFHTGKLITCKLCGRSFHALCLEDNEDLTENWHCASCRFKPNPYSQISARVSKSSQLKSSYSLGSKNGSIGGIFSQLHNLIKRVNERSYELPVQVLDTTQKVFAHPLTGDCISVHDQEVKIVWKKHKLRFPIKDVDDTNTCKELHTSKEHLCCKCGKTSKVFMQSSFLLSHSIPQTCIGDSPVMRNYGIRTPLIKCDYCQLYWHMDCLYPPLITRPIESRSYNTDKISLKECSMLRYKAWGQKDETDCFQNKANLLDSKDDITNQYYKSCGLGICQVELALKDRNINPASCVVHIRKKWSCSTCSNLKTNAQHDSELIGPVLNGTEESPQNILDSEHSGDSKSSLYPDLNYKSEGLNNKINIIPLKMSVARRLRSLVRTAKAIEAISSKKRSRHKSGSKTECNLIHCCRLRRHPKCLNHDCTSIRMRNKHFYSATNPSEEYRVKTFKSTSILRRFFRVIPSMHLSLLYVVSAALYAYEGLDKCADIIQQAPEAEEWIESLLEMQFQVADQILLRKAMSLYLKSINKKYDILSSSSLDINQNLTSIKDCGSQISASVDTNSNPASASSSPKLV